MDLEESERAYELEQQERMDDHAPVLIFGPLRVGQPFLTTSNYRGDS
jgi:hypothetical protein